MKFEDIYTFFKTQSYHYLNKELAVCYVLSVLLEGDSYGSELIQRLELDYPGHRLSDTVLYAGLKFLEAEKMVTTYWKKVEGRGRPRHMYRLHTDLNDRAQEMATLWHNYMLRRKNQSCCN
jgi:DNA-binding PadR family transcriptional regulator